MWEQYEELRDHLPLRICQGIQNRNCHIWIPPQDLGLGDLGSRSGAHGTPVHQDEASRGTPGAQGQGHIREILGKSQDFQAIRILRFSFFQVSGFPDFHVSNDVSTFDPSNRILDLLSTIRRFEESKVDPKCDLRNRKSKHKVNFENQNVETTGSKNRQQKKNNIQKNSEKPRKN